MKELTKDDVLHLASFEKVIFESRREVAIYEARHRQAKFAYAKRVSKITGIKPEYLEFDTSVACSSKVPVSHCVYQSEENHRWPRCVFCGSPKYGD